ncbi:hypothetical protein [Staphylococcus caprae]|uniref:hypothetical protein n=1 Tax=Staphylococcus caprae TaxID=29380 RepID=UPI001452094F|nr:hypothetical protein [Staphylococcus caprae]QJE26657.1 hypothetical protein HHJ99_12875 [Staphylococcus caprae]HEK6547227.1 hypothetical protein [Staphylococcus aureus]
MTVKYNNLNENEVNAPIETKVNTLYAIKEFLFNEYDTEFDSLEDMIKEVLSLNLSIPIAYTTLADDEDIQIQVYLEVNNNKLTKRVSGSNTLTHEEVEFFKNEEEMLEAIHYLTFDELISLKADTDWLIQTLK